MIILLSKLISDYYKLLSMLEEILLSSNRPTALHIKIFRLFAYKSLLIK